MIEKIMECLSNVNKELLVWHNSDEYWITKATGIIKRALIDFSREEFADCAVASHSVEALYIEDGEWLFDLVVYSMNEGKEFPTVKKIHLIVESELSKLHWGGCKEDFDKLLINTKAIKLFIFRREKEAQFEQALRYAQTAVNDFEDFDTNDVIYFIYWDKLDGQCFKHVELRKAIFPFSEV